MSRTSRVPYHQNVYDLLGLEPGVCPVTAPLIAAHEEHFGPLPASVREWYLSAMSCSVGDVNVGKLWSADAQFSLSEVLDQFGYAAGEPLTLFACVGAIAHLPQWLELDSSGDPPVWWLRDFYGRPDDPSVFWENPNAARWSGYTGYVESWAFGSFRSVLEQLSLGRDRRERFRTPRSPHLNGRWLRTPAEPFAPPILDFLAEQFGEPARTPREGDVTTYVWHPEGGTIRLTADHPAHPEPLSAWWVHAESSEHLEELARLLAPWGTLRDTLRADTEPAREVWDRVREC